jgi:hypothetical protein
MTIVLNSKGFKLPRLEREKFLNLMHLGLDYDRSSMLFSIKSYDNIEKVIGEISSILKDEVVSCRTALAVASHLHAKAAATSMYARLKIYRLPVYAPSASEGRK